LIAAPLAGGNYAQDCSTYFFGARTARALIATRVTDNGMTGHAVSRADWLDPDGHRIDAVSIDRIAMLALIVSWLMIRWQPAPRWAIAGHTRVSSTRWRQRHAACR
jgi:hypothetical protein